jgi:hypothetical protein
MGERADAIASHIREERAELGENIRELDSALKRTFSWHTQVQERPFALVGAAFLGGALLSRLVRK